MQKILISGNLTADAELKEFENSKVILFSIADNSNSYTDKDGNKVDNPIFFDCERWFKKDSSTGILDHLKKGKKIIVDGRFKENQWEKDGEKKSKKVLVVSEIELC